ncbi:MAG: hypothetical protein PVF13_01260 [Chromatiales bacterium]|jgi:hypothetical protein
MPGEKGSVPDTNPHLNDDPGAIIAFMGETFELNSSGSDLLNYRQS